MQLLPANKTHFRQILELNKSAVPHVNLIDFETLDKLATQSVAFHVAIEDGDASLRNMNQGISTVERSNSVVGFLIALDETADYESPNFRYFKHCYDSFVYVDRIVISESHQGKGIGHELYRQLQVICKETPILCCEVNIRPPNPASIAFHQNIGFESVDEQETEQGKKRVSLMVMKNHRPITAKQASGI